MSGHITPFKRSAEDDCIEPEIVSGAPRGRAGNGERYHGGAPGPGETHPLYSFFLKIKLVFTAAALLAGFGLILLGSVLTSTLIGAVIGIPLMLLGVLTLWILFKFLTLGGSGKTFVFKRL